MAPQTIANKSALIREALAEHPEWKGNAAAVIAHFRNLGVVIDSNSVHAVLSKMRASSKGRRNRVRSGNGQTGPGLTGLTTTTMTGAGTKGTGLFDPATGMQELRRLAPRYGGIDGLIAAAQLCKTTGFCR